VRGDSPRPDRGIEDRYSGCAAWLWGPIAKKKQSRPRVKWFFGGLAAINCRTGNHITPARPEYPCPHDHPIAAGLSPRAQPLKTSV